MTAFEDLAFVIGQLRDRLSANDPAHVEDRLSLAANLIVQSAMAGGYDSLMEATEILDELLQEPLAPLMRFRVMSERVNLRDMLAARDGTDTGFYEALTEQLKAARAVPEPHHAPALVRAYSDQSRYHEFHLSLFVDIGDSEGKDDSGAFSQHLELALESINKAMAVAPPGLLALPPLETRRGMLMCHLDLDAAVHDLRSGLARVRSRPMLERAPSQVMLANALILRAEDGGWRSRRGLREATRLCREVVASNVPMATWALTGLAKIAELEQR